MAFKEITFLLTIFVLGARAGITWENCDESAPIQLKELNLKSSYPIQIKPNAIIAASGRYYMGYKATNQTRFKVQLKIKKKIGYGWFSKFVSVPCVSKVGSCTYDVTCSQLPGCPAKLGEQSFDESVTIPGNFKIPGGVLGSLLGSGTYKVRVDVRNASNNRRIVCGGGQGEIKL